MRKDVRFGLAIGGVLLAVLIVYVLIVPARNVAPQQTAAAPSGSESSAPDNARTDNTPAAQPAPVYAQGAPTDSTPAERDPAPATPSAQSHDANTPAAQPAPDAVASNPRSPSHDDRPATTDWNQLLAFGQQNPASTKREAAPAQPANVTPSASDAATPTVAADDHSSSPTTPLAQPAAATPSGGTYKVRSGDTLSSIARDAYGSANYYPHIQRANPHLDPRRLHPGMIINLPGRAAVVDSDKTASQNTPAASAAPAAPVDSARQYVVQSGDSLYRISVRLYGNAAQADKLYELNKATIGADPARLKVGMVLQLPQPPTIAQSH